MEKRPPDDAERDSSQEVNSMDLQSAGELTRLIQNAAAGDPVAKHQLIEQVYEELKEMARGKLFRERTNAMCQASSIVHEAWIRIFSKGNFKAPNRAYFFGAMALAMRRILIEHARRLAKRQGSEQDIWDRAVEALEATQKVKYLDLHAALDELTQKSQRQSKVVSLRFFGGLKEREIAGYLGVSVSTVEKDWRAARAWLHQRLRGEES